MKLKIAVVASGPLIAGEIAGIIQVILSKSIDIQTYLTDEVHDPSIADIFICAQTQLKRLSQVVPTEKIHVLDLMPNSKFFIAVARIPKNETVCIFNNYLEYAIILGNYCKNLGITDVDFVPIAYREMSQEEITARLRNAKYIIGVDRLVGNGGLLSPTYSPYLRKDVTIIPATRAASVHSACTLIKCIAVKFHQHIASSIESIQSDLHQNISSATADLAKLKNSVNNLAIFSNKAMDIIQNAVTKSVLNNISSDIIIFDAPNDRLNIDMLESLPIGGVLKIIADSNCTLHLISEKLAKL